MGLDRVAHDEAKVRRDEDTLEGEKVVRKAEGKEERRRCTGGGRLVSIDESNGRRRGESSPRCYLFKSPRPISRCCSLASESSCSLSPRCPLSLLSGGS